MLGQEPEELGYVSPIGLDRLGRHPPFAGKMVEPTRHLGRHLRMGIGEIIVGNRHGTFA
jgi:hypothetical protein